MQKPIELPILILVLMISGGPCRSQDQRDRRFGVRIPAISGQVVDAITGKPVANVDVTLRATALTASLFDGGRSSLRYENDRTSADGRFSFRSSLETKLMQPLTSMEGYWLTVNKTFWSIRVDEGSKSR
jgi:hypothetical protein